MYSGRKHASPIHSRASLNLIVEPGLYMLLRFLESYARKLRDRKPGLFNALEIFDHTRSQNKPQSQSLRSSFDVRRGRNETE
jgi:hypothetical protein